MLSFRRAPASRLLRVALHALDNHGWRGVLVRALGKLRSREDLLPGFDTATEAHPYDARHGTDTGGYIPGDRLATGSAADLYNTAYHGVSPSSLRRALELLPEPVAGSSFVDLGCGKGRALLLAAELPFAHLLGVEIAPALADVARANTARDPRIRIVEGDAIEAQFPPGPLVVFLYHPFLAPAVERALRNLLRQRGGVAEPAYLLYCNCTYRKLLRRLGFAAPVWDYRIPLSAEDRAAHRFGATEEPYALWRL